jgi:hypothetical protein
MRGSNGLPHVSHYRSHVCLTWWWLWVEVKLLECVPVFEFRMFCTRWLLLLPEYKYLSPSTDVESVMSDELGPVLLFCCGCFVGLSRCCVD